MKRANGWDRHSGLSLVELVVVMAVLAVTAGAVISLTGNMDSKSRYDETARRLGEIRSAILGPDAVSDGGELLSGGYLQDVGWLPDSATDLFHAPEIAPGAPMPGLKYDSTWKTWYGWRGAYLAAPPARETGGVGLYDGWGGEYYGWFSETSGHRSWEVPRLSGDCAVRSLGSDGKKDSDGGKSGVYERDYPDVEQPLICESDWVSDIQGLQVVVTNLSDVDYSATPVRVRFRIIVPRWDRSDPLGYWPANPDSDEFIGKEFTLNLKGVSDTQGLNQGAFDFGFPDHPLRIPHGRRMLFIVQSENGRPLDGVQACTELLISRRLSMPSSVKIVIRDQR